MISLELLKRRGLTEKSMREKFTADVKDEKTAKLLRLIESRVINGRTQNLNTFKTYWAIDAAYDAPFQQQEAIITQLMMTRNLTLDDAVRTCAEWGLREADMFYEEDVNGTKVKKLKIKNFYNVLVPIMKAYVTIRRAKMFNDRNTYPLFKYEPISFTAEKRALCEVLTDITQRMATDFGLSQYLNQVILQTLLYGFCLMFIKEPWYPEYQMTDAEKYTVKKGDSLTKLADRFNVTVNRIKAANTKAFPEDSKAKLEVGQVLTIPERRTCVKEGLRYETPHPTRCFFDLAYPTNTINTDTGVSFAGYWRVMKYGELEANPQYWNKDTIPFGANNWLNWTGARAFWTEVYPCALKYPDQAVFGTMAAGAQMREQRLIYNVSNDFDTPVFVTDLVMKIVPSQYGLADYDYPVWMKFLVANDNTVLWAGVVPYCPILYSGYDADNYRWPNASMALEIMPFQIQLGNILSQVLFTGKQALWKGMFYDDQMLDPETIRTLQNRGDGFAGIQFIKYDSKQARVSQLSPEKAFVPVTIGGESSAEMMGQINVVISVLERLLGMSASEVGSPATHEQTAEEIRVIATNTSVRVEFTGSFVDEFIKAWKVQLYQAQVTYLDDEFMAQVNPTPETYAALNAMGFDVPSEFDADTYADNKMQVLVPKAKMQLDGFASERDGANRINNQAVAAVLMQGVQSIVSQDSLLQTVGPKAALDLLTEAMILAGAPRDFRLRIDPKATPQMQMQSLQEQVGQMGQQIMAEVMKQVGEGVKPLAEAIKQNQEQLAQVGPAFEQVMQRLGQMQEGFQQLAQATGETAKLATATKQEADMTAKTVLEMSGILRQLAPSPAPPPEAAPVGGSGIEIQPETLAPVGIPTT